MTGTDSNLQRVSSHVVVCLNEIKMGVIAKAAVYPGANTLIMNLLSSFSDEDGDDDAQVRIKSRCTPFMILQVNRYLCLCFSR